MKKALVISFHDLSPASQGACRALLALAARQGAERLSLLVVPRWHGASAPAPNAAFSGWLRAQADAGHEMVLHGYQHRADALPAGLARRAMATVYTNREGEFYDLDFPSASVALAEGLRWFGGIGLARPRGFVAPAWLLSRPAWAAVRAAGFEYTTTLQRIHPLGAGQPAVFAPSLVYSARAAWRRWVSLLWVPLWHALQCRRPVLRLAVHPLDMEYPLLRAALAAVLRRALGARTAMTYAAWLAAFREGRA